MKQQGLAFLTTSNSLLQLLLLFDTAQLKTGTVAISNRSEVAWPLDYDSATPYRAVFPAPNWACPRINPSLWISAIIGMECTGDNLEPEELTSGTNPALSRRAPTITINTSAVAITYQGPSSLLNPPSPAHHQQSLSIENRLLLVFGSIPASPHQISSPTARERDKSPEPQNLLTFPGTCPRENSVDHTHLVSPYGRDTVCQTPTRSDYSSSRGESSEAWSFYRLGNNDPLKADPGEENRCHIEDSPFAFSAGQLSKLFNTKSLAAF